MANLADGESTTTFLKDILVYQSMKDRRLNDPSHYQRSSLTISFQVFVATKIWFSGRKLCYLRHITERVIHKAK